MPAKCEYIYKIADKYQSTIFVIILYNILTILLTYPVAFKISTHIPGGGDAWQWMRVLWYTKIAIFHPDITSLYYDHLLFYPNGVPGTAFPSAFSQFVYIVLSPIFELHVIYTILWLNTFILGALGTYLLVKYLTNNPYAAFVSGLAFSFTPYHMVHAQGHFGATSIQWIPFCALFLMKVYREGGRRNGVVAGVFFILVAMSDMQYMMFTGIFVALLVIYELFTELKKNNDYFYVIEYIASKYIVFLVVVTIGILPLFINEIAVASSEQNFLKPNTKEVVTYSTDLLSFFLPSIGHPLFGDLVRPIYNNFSGNATEHTTFIGYTVLILSVFIFLTGRKQELPRFWLLTALLFSLFSLGPILSINGKTAFTAFNVVIPLPHLILYYLIPFLENCRTTGRFFVIAALAFAVLAGYGISKILDKRAQKTVIITIILCALIIFEFLAVPFPVSYVDKPEIYKKISSDQENYAILEIPPASLNYGAAVKFAYYQTIHGKPLVGNHYARIPSDARQFEMNTPLVSELTYINKNRRDILIQDSLDVGLSVLNYYDIRYIILHEDYLSKEQFADANEILNNSLHLNPVYYSADSLIVYEIPNAPIRPFMILSGNCWHGLEDWSGTPTRWMENNATLMIYSNDRSISDLSFNARSFQRPRTLEIYVNDHPQHIYAEIPNNRHATVNVPRINLNKGVNIVRFHVPEGCEKPADIPELNNPDRRCLSVAVQDIQITKDILINDQESSSISLGTGWHGLEDWSGAPTRWIENDTTLMIASEENRMAELSFQVMSFYRPRTLEMYAGDALEIREVINASGFAAIKIPVHLKEGTNIMRFRVIEGCEKPSEIPQLRNTDGRCLSLAFQDIRIS